MNENEKSETEDHFDQWALLELMGHRKFAGRVREVQIGGASFLRIDVPSEPPATQFYAPAAVYCITPTTEETCRAFARRAAPAPIQRWELLPPPTRPGVTDLPAHTSAGVTTDDIDDDDDEIAF